MISPFRSLRKVIGKSCVSPRLQQGFTLLELLVVLLILGLLASIAAPQVFKYLGRAKSHTAKIQIDALTSNLSLYRLDVGHYPTTDQGLKVLVEKPSDEANWSGPYITSANSLKDPWGNKYQYLYPGKHGEIDVFSLGADNAVGGEGENADVTNW
jgi:general secretion pathway protein G